MKITRMLGIALIAAIAATALIAAPGATAKPVQLCKVKANNCSPANEYGVGTKIKASLQPGTTMNLTGSLPVTCTGSSFEGELTELGGQQAVGKITNMAYSNCSVFGFIPCKYIGVQLPYTFHITQDTVTLGNGQLWMGPQTSGQPGFLTECQGVTSCLFKGDETQSEEFAKEWSKLAITSGAPAKIGISNGVFKLTNGTTTECGSSMSINANYSITEPSPLYVVHQE